MKTIAIAVALIVVSMSAAQAGYTCQRFGNQTRCWGDGGSVTCQQFGNQTRCW